MRKTITVIREKKLSAEPVRPKKRTRRAPEEARVLLLDAAERVFGKHLPDTVGLKEIAREAGVSHALVSHYFGTYEALVEATLERRVSRLREELLASAMKSFESSKSPGDLLAQYRKALEEVASDPLTPRLAIWALLSGRANAHDFFPGKRQGLRAIADVVAARSGNDIPRADIEFSLLTSFAMTVTWVFAKRALLSAMGRKYSSADDAWFDTELRRMLEGYQAETK